MPQFSLVALFTSMGFDVSFNERQMLQFGLPDCTPLAAIVQINSQMPLNREEINAQILRGRKCYPKLSFIVILSFGGFICEHGNYNNEGFLLDSPLIEQMIRGKDIFRDFLFSIIREYGKPTKGSSLDKWANQQARSLQGGYLSESEVKILTNAQVVMAQSTVIDEWSNNLLKYKRFIDNPRSFLKVPDELKSWAKLQYDDLENQNLSVRKQKQMLNHNLLWPAEYSVNQKYDELIDFIDRNKRLPSDHEEKLYRFMQKEISSMHERFDELRDRFKRFDPSVKCEENLWLRSLEPIVNEFKTAKRKIWKLKPETILWINAQMQCYGIDRITKFKQKELAQQLRCTGEQFDYDWLVTLDAYSNLTAPPELGSEMWLWAVHQRRGNLEIYKRKALQKIKFDFNPINKINDQWYDCYKRISQVNPELRKNVFHIGKDGIYWAYSNRKAYADGSLSAEKLHLLEKIDFDFKVNEFSWLHLYDKVKEFYSIENIGQNREMPAGLKDWCAAQRKQMSDVNLLGVFADKLLSVGFVYIDPMFEEFIEKLNTLVDENKGHLPQNFEDYPWVSSNSFRLAYAREIYHRLNPELLTFYNPTMFYFPILIEFWKNEETRWHVYTEKMQRCANSIRINHKDGILEPDIVRQLNQVGFHWEEAGIEKWLYMQSKTKRFINLYQRPPGHSDNDCSSWRFKQLRLYNAQNLSEFKRNALQSIIRTQSIKKAAIQSE